jgi:phosphoglycolate phosphatase-like HAD superfamily hydrolase
MIKINRRIPKDKLKLLIFDLDGTLVDSRKDLANSINAMLENYHRPKLADDVIATYSRPKRKNSLRTRWSISSSTIASTSWISLTSMTE